MQLLRWSDHVPASEVQDPLGLGLRGSARLSSLLLFCITSITPRARYFSFIPWSISDWQEREKGKSHALGLKQAISVRDRALTIGCIAHHEGEGCDGPGLNGVRKGKKWFATSAPSVDLKKLKLTKNSVLGAYFTSLVNLGCFVSEQERTESEELIKDSEFTFDDIELSEFGQELATAYGSSIGRLGSVKHLSEIDRTCSVSSLKEFGKRGGLCELADPSSPDRDLLRDLFFARKGITAGKHFRRNRSLTLILELCRQFSSSNWPINAFSFSSAVYYGRLVDDEGGAVIVSIPEPLTDVATRWRMFYFHHFMSVALEGMFSWLVTQLNSRGLSGASLSELLRDLDSPLVSRSLSEHLAFDVSTSFGSATPSAFFKGLGLDSSFLDDALSHEIDDTITAEHSAAEVYLEATIRDRTFLQSPTGLAIPLILFALTLGRYRRWESTQYGQWLSIEDVVKDPYLDLLPSTVSFALKRNQGDWWNQSWVKLAEYMLSRFIIQQHQSISYDKTAIGDRCLLQVDGQQVIADSPYEKIGLGNPRLNSAIQVLLDLALIQTDDSGVSSLTKDGTNLLKKELARGAET